MSERREIAQLDCVVTHDAISFADRSKHFRLLDCIDAQVCFEIKIEV